MDSAVDGSIPDNYRLTIALYMKFRHGLHHCLC